MSGNEKIRYVHIMEHPDLDETFEVGCVCAEKMSGDYEGRASALACHRLLINSHRTRSHSMGYVAIL
jgi:hypothetical protein